VSLYQAENFIPKAWGQRVPKYLVHEVQSVREAIFNLVKLLFTVNEPQSTLSQKRRMGRDRSK